MQELSIQRVSKVTTKNGEQCIQLDIPIDRTYPIVGRCGKTFNVVINSVTMLVVPGDWADTLRVNWDHTVFENIQEPFHLMMHNPDTRDEVTSIMGGVYWKKAFNEQLREILRGAGFSEQAVADVDGSEWGMQSPGQATYDAYTVANELCLAHHLEVMPE